MIELRPVTPDNWRSGLSVREDQKEFVAPSAGILARAWAYREYRSQAFLVYEDETPVGMAMFHDDPEDPSAYIFDQFFIEGLYILPGGDRVELFLGPAERDVSAPAQLVEGLGLGFFLVAVRQSSVCLSGAEHSEISGVAAESAVVHDERLFGSPFYRAVPLHILENSVSKRLFIHVILRFDRPVKR